MAVDEDRLRELWADRSNTLKAIAEEFGVHISTVSYHATRLNLPPRRVSGKRVMEQKSVVLRGGRWVPGRHGILHWVANATD